jgi:uncharacterized protein (DUF362 family)
MRKLLLLTIVIAAFAMAAGFTTCANVNRPRANNLPGKNGPVLGPDDFIAWFVDTPPVIDGIGDDAAWARAQWQPIKYEWMNSTPPDITPVKGPDDFSGRFKVVWTADRLYILAEITDDIISVTHTNPYISPEKNDCLELFLDENASGGDRTSDGGNNFFTYHMSFNGVNVTDHIGSYTDNITNDPATHVQGGNILRNSHFNYKIGKNDAAHTYIWEIEMKVYDNTYPLRSSPDIPPITLTEGKKIGFAAAYCDADARNTREHFIGSMFVTGSTDNERNSSYQNSTQYAKMYLMKGADSIVSIVQSTAVTQASDFTYNEILALTRQAIKLAGGLEGIVKKGDVVVLKPNVIVTNYFWGWGDVIPELANGVCTDRRVIQAVAEIVREIVGPSGKIMVIEGSGNGSSTVNFANLGYTLHNLANVDEIIALENEGTWAGPGDASGSMAYVRQIALDDFAYKPPISTGKYGSAAGNYSDYYKGDGKYWVNKKMLEADALICIPVVKQHWDAVVTGAIKNIAIGAAPPSVYGLNGTFAGRNGMVNHAAVANFHGWIADYFSCLPADFVVMDGLQGLQNGPLPHDASSEASLAQHQKNLRCILASKDPLAIDIVEANLMNWDYTTVPYFSTLTAKGQVPARGETGKPNGRKIPLRGNPQDIVVLGNVKVDDVRADFEGTMSPMMPGDKISATKKTKPAVTINSAAFSGPNLNLDLTLSTGADTNVVKIDVYVDGEYAASFKSDMTSAALDASRLTRGSHRIEVRAYTSYMYSATAVATATKT